jgi:hypothetical protein
MVVRFCSSFWVPLIRGCAAPVVWKYVALTGQYNLLRSTQVNWDRGSIQNNSGHETGLSMYVLIRHTVRWSTLLNLQKAKFEEKKSEGESNQRWVEWEETSRDRTVIQKPMWWQSCDLLNNIIIFNIVTKSLILIFLLDDTCYLVLLLKVPKVWSKDCTKGSKQWNFGRKESGSHRMSHGGESQDIIACNNTNPAFWDWLARRCFWTKERTTQKKIITEGRVIFTFLPNYLGQRHPAQTPSCQLTVFIFEAKYGTGWIFIATVVLDLLGAAVTLRSGSAFIHLRACFVAGFSSKLSI